MNHLLLLCATGTFLLNVTAAQPDLAPLIDAVEPQVITWRRDIHQHPELGNRETRTAALIAAHLRSLGMDVKTNVAKTGVVGLLKGSKPGPVVALRADMDALPITERAPLPFASKARGTYNGQEVGVMHACGHDTHVAMLMGAATVLSAQKNELRGSVKFIFQPAEEGPPVGEEGGAQLMVKEGVLENPKVDVIFGLHISSQLEVGKVSYRPGGTMASASDFKITVKGRGAHGAGPWNAVDPIVTGAQIVNALQTIVSRNLNITENPGVVTIGSFHAGNRFNIIPEEVEMMGTIRALSTDDEKMMNDRVRQIATNIAASAGAHAEVKLPFSVYYPVTHNDPALLKAMLPSIKRSVGETNALLRPPVTGAEDFSYYQQKVPGLFVFIGGMPIGGDEKKAPSHHTPDFIIDEGGLKTGVTLLCNLTLDYLNKQPK